MKLLLSIFALLPASAWAQASSSSSSSSGGAYSTAPPGPKPSPGAIPLSVLHPKNMDQFLPPKIKLPNIKQQLVDILSNPSPKLTELAGIVVAVTSVCTKAQTELQNEVPELNNMFGTHNGLSIIKNFCNDHGDLLLQFYNANWQKPLESIVRQMVNTSMLDSAQDKILMAYNGALQDHNARVASQKLAKERATYEKEVKQYEELHPGYEPPQMPTGTDGLAQGTMVVEQDGDVQARFGWWTVVPGWQTMGFPPIPPVYQPMSANSGVPTWEGQQPSGTGTEAPGSTDAEETGTTSTGSTGTDAPAATPAAAPVVLNPADFAPI